MNSRKTYFSAEEMSEVEVEYIGVTENKQDHPNTISVTKKTEKFFIAQIFNKK